MPTLILDTTGQLRTRIHLGRPWPQHWCQFEQDMTVAGLAIHECAGPNGWGGPAVTVLRVQQAMVETATTVTLDSHDVASDSVMLYPAVIDARTGKVFEA